jgi:acetyltransferase-like isoleucine patch superfamily enzyme
MKRPTARWKQTLTLLAGGGRIYSAAAYGFGLMLPGGFDGGPVAWLRGWPRPQIVPGRGRIEIGHVGLYPGVKLHCLGAGRIAVGSGSYLNRFTRVTAGRSIRLGRGCMVSWDVIITDALVPDPGGTGAIRTFEPVEIGDRVWIASRVVILGGTCLGDGCVVGAGSIVQGVYPAGTVLTGIPAKEGT